MRCSGFTLSYLEVGLGERDAQALPRALSGGQRQRAAIARALAAEPTILILDEAVAALDVSIQAQVLNRLADVREETGMTYIFISHDLSVVRQLTQETIVMQHGKVVERGSTDRVLDAPEHEYTKRLRKSVPVAGWKPKRAWLEHDPSRSTEADEGDPP
jgi:oligopeptide transport system ATP-binding protein